jgi:hypothetical protein
MPVLRNSNGILNFAPKRDGGVLALGNPSADNAILGYLAGALQGGNLGQSIGRGLEGFVAGTRLDEQRLAPAQTYAALAAAAKRRLNYSRRKQRLRSRSCGKGVAVSRQGIKRASTPGPISTTLADLLTPLLAANPFLTMRASLRR